MGAWRASARRVGAQGWGPEEWEPEGWGARNFALFFPLSRFPFRSFCLSGGLLVEFWWCLKRRDPQMCTFEVLGLSCETLAAPQARGERSWGGRSWGGSEGSRIWVNFHFWAALGLARFGRSWPRHTKTLILDKLAQNLVTPNLGRVDPKGGRA